MKKNKFTALDAFLLLLLILGAAAILIPFFNMIAVSFTTYKEYMESKWVIWPKNPTLQSYKELLNDARLLYGYKTTLTYVIIGVPLNLFLEMSLAYALFRKGWPGRKLVLMLVLFTMIFNGGIVPLYLVMKQLKLTNRIWSVIFALGFSSFNMILLYNYLCSLPESLMESASLDGASEWTIMFRIAIPLSKPILATVTLFVMVNLWNEYFFSLIFVRSSKWMALQQVLRAIVLESQILDSNQGMATAIEKMNFSDGMKMAAVVLTMVPIMCIYPFLQRYFTKGIMIGAIKA